jgi:hypothetical protein
MIDTNKPITLIGTVTRDTGKSWGILTEADGITRYIAKSQVIDAWIEPVVGLDCIICVPAWLLKRRDGTYPKWTGLPQYAVREEIV